MKLIDADSLREKLEQKVMEADRKSRNDDIMAAWSWMLSKAAWLEALLILDQEKEVDTRCGSLDGDTGV